MCVLFNFGFVFFFLLCFFSHYLFEIIHVLRSFLIFCFLGSFDVRMVMHQLKLMSSKDLLIIFFHPFVIHNLFEEGRHEFLEVSIAGFSISILYVEHIFNFVDELHDDIVVIAVLSIFEQHY